MDKFIYSGSGIGAPENFLFIKNDDEKAKPTECNFNQLSFITSTNDKYLGVMIKENSADICILENIEGKIDLQVVKTIETGAVYYPCLSKDENKIAYIETPDINYPPKNESLGLIRVIEKKNDVWEDINFQEETFIDPISWFNEDDLLYPNKEGNLIKTNVINEKKPEKLADNVFYPISFKEKIAFYDGGHICLLEKGNLNKIKISEDAQFLSFNKDGTKVIYTYKSGMWKYSASTLDLQNNEISKVFETARIDFIKEL
jgi:hypothetical protein